MQKKLIDRLRERLRIPTTKIENEREIKVTKSRRQTEREAHAERKK